jgi:hypothetical protein
MSYRATIEVLNRYPGLLQGKDPETEARAWEWATIGQLEEWIEYGECVRGEVARALRNVGCTPQMCSRQVVIADGKEKSIGFLAAEGKITIQEARRLALGHR